MNTYGYKYIKELYEDILYSSTDDIHSIRKTDSFRDIVNNIYQNCKKDYLNEHTWSVKLMEISPDELDNLLLENIFSNLYEHLTVISQNVAERGVSHEAYLYWLSPEGDEKENQLYKERFRKRIQPDRMNTLKTTPNIETFSWTKKNYIPTIMKAYKDVMLVPRKETSILDISPNYIDIFTALMYETQAELSNDVYIVNRDMIKAYQIWDFSTITIEQIERIYQQIKDARSKEDKSIKSDAFAELLFVERLFGFFNICEFLKKDLSKEEYLDLIKFISDLSIFGYSNLHKTIIQKINTDNKKSYYNMIAEYICPLCIECIVGFINSLIIYIKPMEKSSRIAVIDKYRKDCKSMLFDSPVCEASLSYSLCGQINILKKYKKLSLGKNFHARLVKNFKAINNKYCTQSQTHIDPHRTDHILDYKQYDSDECSIYDSSFTEIAGLYNDEEIPFDFFHSTEEQTPQKGKRYNY